MNTSRMKYEIVSAQEYNDHNAFKFCIRLLEASDQTILENDYANLIKECAKLRRTYANTAFTFGVQDSRGYLFWMNYTDQCRALFLEDLEGIQSSSTSGSICTETRTDSILSHNQPHQECHRIVFSWYRC